jgi:hypothetical protein
MSTFAMMLGEYNYIDNFSSGINDPFSIDGCKYRYQEVE